jgi:hypothetical protein
MAYDIQAATEAGHSIDDQLAHLAKLHNYDIKSAEEAGHSKEDQLNYLAGLDEPSQSIGDKISGVLGVDDTISAPAVGTALGAVTGSALGSQVGGATDAALEYLAKKIAPTAVSEAELGAPKGVTSWLKQETGHPYAGGKTKEEAFLKSEIARGKPVKSRGSEMPIRKGRLGITNQLEVQEPTLAKKAATNIIEGERLGKPGMARRMLGMGVAGGELGNVKEELEKGNYGRAALSGLGALGGVASQSRIKPIRTIGTALSAGVPALQYFLPDTEEDVSNINKKAGGSVQNFQVGGTVLKKLGADAKPLWEKLKYDRYKIAQDYPDVIPPVLAKDPKTGKEFLQKQLSPEALEVQKARKAAQKQIDVGNYQPLFDIEKRYYADPSHYPTAGYTATDIVPKKAETIEKYTALANDPEALARLRGAYEKAKDRPMAKNWYAMGQLEDAFIKELGEVEGRKQFKNRFADAMAATTGGADPNSNLMMAAYTNYVKNLGRDIPTKAADLPFPIGGRFVSGNMEQAKKLAEAGEIPVTNPKRHNFSANFLGHRDVSTLDEQMSQLWDPKMMSPPPNAYGIYQQALAKEAEKAGVQPANFQDIAWAGAKDYPGKPMMQEINEMIARTHAITGEPPEEILKGFIRGNKPMYGIGALSATGIPTEEEPAAKKKGGKIKKK